MKDQYLYSGVSNGIAWAFGAVHSIQFSLTDRYGITADW